MFQIVLHATKKLLYDWKLFWMQSLKVFKASYETIVKYVINYILNVFGR